jgi:hypothetical protein
MDIQNQGKIPEEIKKVPGVIKMKGTPKSKKSKYQMSMSKMSLNSVEPTKVVGAHGHGSHDENQDDCSLPSTSDDEIVADIAENHVTATVVNENFLEQQINSKYLKPPPVLVPGVRMNSISFDKMKMASRINVNAELLC